MGHTNIFPRVHRGDNEEKELVKDAGADLSPDNRRAFFPRRRTGSRNSARDVSRTTQRPVTIKGTKGRFATKAAAYDSDEEEMIERLVETQE
jgi:hypothetical protein